MGSASVLLSTLPYQRNPLFTGRDGVLEHLHQMLSAGKTTALAQPRAISGLGGIGKTQTAVEYAYRYHQDYRYIFWIKAESRETLLTDFSSLAQLFNLSDKQEQEASRIVEGVKRWFEDHIGWLLIFDNADDLSILREFLPGAGKGHILLTTRSQVTGSIAQPIEIEQMEPEEGAAFLLHRAHLLEFDASLDAASSRDRQQAMDIVQVMGGLPLALDQAGAFIEETRCSLADYLSFFQTRQTDLLKRRGRLVTDHKESVATTWSLAFEKIEQASPSAADLLRLCAFLDPDLIPEELPTKGAPAPGTSLQVIASDPIKRNEAIGTLLTYSLIRRNPNNTLTIHRLVQAVLKNDMNKTMQHRWATRAVRAVSHAFPEVTYSNWPSCQQYLPQVQACMVLIDQWHMTFPEAAALLMEAATYLQESAQFAQAEPLYQRALHISETALGAEHPDTAATLHGLARLYQARDQYQEAEPLYQRALHISETIFGAGHPSTSTTLHALASLYQAQGRYQEAEPLYQRALRIRETTLGAKHPDTISAKKDYSYFLRSIKRRNSA